MAAETVTDEKAAAKNEADEKVAAAAAAEGRWRFVVRWKPCVPPSRWRRLGRRQRPKRRRPRPVAAAK